MSIQMRIDASKSVGCAGVVNLTSFFFPFSYQIKEGGSRVGIKRPASSWVLGPEVTMAAAQKLFETDHIQTCA